MSPSYSFTYVTGERPRFGNDIPEASLDTRPGCGGRVTPIQGGLRLARLGMDHTDVRDEAPRRLGRVSISPRRAWWERPTRAGSGGKVLMVAVGTRRVSEDVRHDCTDEE